MSMKKSISKEVKAIDKRSFGEKLKSGIANSRKATKFAMHVITHPFDGYWDLAHEHKGSFAFAMVSLVLFLITRILKLLCTNFQFINAPTQYVNIFEECASLLLPFLILCLANWSLTTLFDGKGTFKNIFMGMCYALIPYTLIQLPMILVSNMITFEEMSFYTVILGISMVWCIFLAFVGLMEIHDYSPLKTFGFLLFTIFGAAVIIFLVLVFFSLLGDAVSYFVSLYREIVFRLN